MNFRFKNKLKLEPGFKQFLIKTAVFILMFIIFSAIVGLNLYSQKLLYGFYIYIYGRVGYILLFAIAGFVLIYKKRLLKLPSFKYKIRDFLFIILSFIFLFGFYIIEISIAKIPFSLFAIIPIHILGVSIFLALGLGVYGLSFVKNLLKKFKKEIFYFLIFGAVMAGLMSFVWKLWPFFSWVVLKITAFLLNLINADFQVIYPDIIKVKDFAAKIAEACSGVYSIFIFTSLYLFIVFLDWKKMNKKKASLLFIPAVFGAFFVNVLRVFMLFLVGGYISEEVAMGLYHSYTGMIFFLIYFSIFWFLFYKWMKNEPGLYKKFIQDSLYKNSIYLMFGTLVMALTGFVFWMINARLFTPNEVGLATTIISTMGIITSFSLLGLSSGLIRFLGKSKRKNDKINTCFTLVAIVTIIITTIFLLSINKISPKLLFIKENLILSFVFIIFMIFASWHSLIDGVFIAYRKAGFVLLKNSIFSVSRLFLPFLLVGLGAYGIFSSWMIAVTLGFLVSVIMLTYRFDYKFRFVFYDSIIKRIGKYSFGNYVAGFIGGLPALLLPLIIISKIGAEASAYYYMAMMIAALLFVIPQATSNSLFAEGSYDEKELKKHLKKAMKIISLLLIPTILFIVFFGKYILLFLGESYAEQGFRFLQLLALSGVFVAVNSVFSSIFRIRKRIKSLIFRNIINAVLIVGLSLYFIKIGLGLLGIGYAWLIGQGITSLFFIVFYSLKSPA